jgi:hypothetical protein
VRLDHLLSREGLSAGEKSSDETKTCPHGVVVAGVPVGGDLEGEAEAADMSQ